MQRTAALLAAFAAIAAPSCGGNGGAEPGAPDGAARPLTLILDFQPNAVHTGIYAAHESDRFAGAGIELTIREPGESTDAPKLLEAGRADLAIMDIHDLAIARERGSDLVGVGAIIQRPLASVIAGDALRVRRPSDLAGHTVGVTGLPSDDAVLDVVLSADGADPRAVERVTIGFDSVAAISAGRVEAATAFWNAEGVDLDRLGVSTRVFRVDDFGAPAYPELVLVATREAIDRDPGAIRSALGALRAGTEAAIADPGDALEALLSAVPELDRATQRAQLEALIEAQAFSPPLVLRPQQLRQWASFVFDRGITSAEPSVGEAFEIGLSRASSPSGP